mmetsp:Transcript_11792/g.33593  ORF Transcript_11792/g.33593 Transcript_11792/m.33593 type:complete len:405 (-) Transcript_11792:221-1435(-)
MGGACPEASSQPAVERTPPATRDIPHTMALLDASDSGALSELEAAIRDFVADESRDSMQLPRLTTGQRRRARAAIAEAHPELRCENTGTGAERRLVLLKAGAAALAAAPAAEAPEDLGAAIAAFLADATRESWELPPLGAERRREAKRLAEAHPELRCESFGFGAERRLHLFKRSELSDTVEAAALVAAMPLPLRLPCPELAGGGDEHVGECNSNASTCASFRSGSPEPGKYTPLPEGFLVRNTFICSVGDEEAADTRAVRSMPAGMFGRCLLDEVARSARGASAVVAAASRETSPKPAEGDDVPQQPEADPQSAFGRQPKFVPGSEVEIFNLTKCPEFNGVRGSVYQLDEATDRYDVLLSEPGQQRWAKIRAENLRAAVPLYAAALSWAPQAPVWYADRPMGR